MLTTADVTTDNPKPNTNHRPNPNPSQIRHSQRLPSCILCEFKRIFTDSIIA